MSDPDSVTVSETIVGSAEAVATCVAGPHGLANWLCDEAFVEKRAGGRLTFHWNDGRRSVGRWTEYAPPTALAWRWRFDDQAGEGTVAFKMTPTGQDVRVEAAVSVAPGEDPNAVETWWRDALSLLKSYVETGRDERYWRRPMLGVMLEPVDAEVAARHELPVQTGIYLSDVVPDHGAAKAGLAKGDVLVRLGDHPLTDWGSITVALDAHHAGDVVEVECWRAGAKQVLKATLGGREHPAFITDPAELRAALPRELGRVIDRLGALAPSEAQAARQPAEGEWSAKQVLAHLSLSERWSFDAWARILADEPPKEYAPQAFEIAEQILAAQPFADLVRRVTQDLRDNQVMALTVLDRDASPRLVYEIASSLHYGVEHLDEHLAQIEQAIESAVAGGVV